MIGSDARWIHTVAETFRAHLQDTLDDARIEAAVAKLKALAGSYPATGKVASGKAYVHVTVSVPGGKTFDGDADGTPEPGGGVFGDVFTDDLERLFRDTDAFELQATPEHTTLLFFDAEAGLLGCYRAGPVSSAPCVGSGSGFWS